jgi:hypothetical protein
VNTFNYKTIRVWDRFIPSSNRFITRTVQRCEDCKVEMYRLIAKDHDADGGSNGGSVCVFDQSYSDCETNMGEHYKLGVGSLKTFTDIGRGAEPGPINPAPAPPKPTGSTKRKTAAKTTDSCDVCSGGGRTCQPCYWEKHPPACEYGRQPGSIYCNRFPAGDPRNNE